MGFMICFACLALQHLMHETSLLPRAHMEQAVGKPYPTFEITCSKTENSKTCRKFLLIWCNNPEGDFKLLMNL